jgi:IclR family transcriptional regulator, acetate operon repressor
MAGVMARSLAILELLARHPAGLSVGAVAGALELPMSATHRLLQELGQHGYVRQPQAGGDYALTLRLAALGLGFLAQSGISDLAQPVLNDLAQDAGELVRLSVLDGEDLVWVAVAQGATRGLRYDPGREQGVVVDLAQSASGRAYLATLPEAEALRRVRAQALPLPEGAVPEAAVALTDLPQILERARAQGYALACDSYLAGMAAMARAVRDPAGRVLGCLSIAGPSVRMTAERMQALAPALAAAAEEMGRAACASPCFREAGA